VFVFGLALSLSMECVQFYEPRRVASLSDVYANAAGALAGALAALELRRVRQPFVIALLGCWIGYRLFPYGSPDSSQLSLIDLCRYTAAWPAIGALLESLTGLHRSRWLIGMFAGTLWLTRMLVTGALPSPAELLGGALGCLLWALASLAPDKASYRKRAALAAMLLTVVVILQSLEPFKFSAAAQPFRWVPFRQFMIGSLAMAPLVLFGKAFTYGSLVWLWVRAGSPWGLATAACGVLVLCLLLIQTHLPARPAEITDAVILLMAAAFLRLVR
jgi:VanZ family protein